MKKVLTAVIFLAVIGFATPAFSAPHGHGGGMHGGHHGHGGGGVHRIHHGHGGGHIAHHGHRPHHGGFIIQTGFPRYNYMYNYAYNYFSPGLYNYNLGYNPYLYPPVGMPVPVGGASFSVRF